MKYKFEVEIELELTDDGENFPDDDGEPTLLQEELTLNDLLDVAHCIEGSLNPESHGTENGYHPMFDGSSLFVKIGDVQVKYVGEPS